MKQGKTLVVGLGEVGGALAEVLERSLPVLRVDIEPRHFDDRISVMHICFPFQSRGQFESAAIGHMDRHDPYLTIINSTVLPGTTAAIAKRSGRAAVYSPIRGKHARMQQDMLRYAKFVASERESWSERAQEHFRQAGMKTRRIARPETLELAKLGETTYFGVLIAFAQELNRYAQQVNGDYSEAISFFEEIDFLPKARYFPGFIGGHCVMPNIELLLQLAPCPLLAAMVDSNQRRGLELKSPEENPEGRNERL